jgi:hypothetical protein
LGASLDADHLIEVKFVRNVAPKKEMMRVSFRVPRNVLLARTGLRRRSCSNSGEEDNSSSRSKKHCTEET